MMSPPFRFLTLILYLLLTAGLRAAAEIPQYQVYELVFEGSALSPEDSPVRDVILKTTWKHEQGEVSYQLFGFWDGDGKGGSEENVFKVRFCPTLPGEWKLASVISNDPKLLGLL